MRGHPIVLEPDLTAMFVPHVMLSAAATSS
eukprot:COSAG02_NODE_39524_length_416_cov_0.753943_1_plen_29_part_01